jgi:hypothetical protein
MVGAAVIAIAGCNSQTVVDEHHAAPAYITATDSVVVLGRKTNSQYEAEDKFIECVGNALNSEVRVIPEQEFVDNMYPWFEALTAPTNVAQLGALLENQAVARKIASYGVRYVVWLDGFKETTNQTGSMSCAIGPGGGGCLGFTTWDDEANYEASIWDFKDLSLTGKISAETKGTNYMPAVIVPIPILARVQATACRTMANQIAGFFEIGDPPEARPSALASGPGEGGSCEATPESRTC